MLGVGEKRKEKEWQERKVSLTKGDEQSKTCIRMFLLQKHAFTKKLSVLERMRKNALFFLILGRNTTLVNKASAIDSVSQMHDHLGF